MERMAKCPHCGATLALSAGLAPHERVACSLCRIEFVAALARDADWSEHGSAMPSAGASSPEIPAAPDGSPPSLAELMQQLATPLPSQSPPAAVPPAVGPSLVDEPSLDNNRKTVDFRHTAPTVSDVSPELSELLRKIRGEGGPSETIPRSAPAPAAAPTEPTEPNELERLAASWSLAEGEEPASFELEPSELASSSEFAESAEESMATAAYDPSRLLAETAETFDELESSGGGEELAASPFSLSETHSGAATGAASAATAGVVVRSARSPRRRRRPSVVGSLVGVVGGGACGIAAGYYLLMWLLFWLGRPDVDPLQVAGFLPSAILPPPLHRPSETDQPNELLADRDSVPEEQGVKQATFEAPATETAPQEITPEPDPIEPAKETDLAASTLAATASSAAGRIASAPSYGLSDLTAATELSRESIDILTTGNPATDLQAMGRSYATVARLAHVLTFFDSAKESGDPLVVESEAKLLFQRAFRQPQQRQAATMIAGHWIHSRVRQHGGVFFAGMPLDGNVRGEVFEYLVPLENGEQVVVLRAERIELDQPGIAGYGFVGNLIDKPAERVAGYTGAAEQAVWCSYLLPLGETVSGRLLGEPSPLEAVGLEPRRVAR